MGKTLDRVEQSIVECELRAKAKRKVARKKGNAYYAFHRDRILAKRKETGRSRESMHRQKTRAATRYAVITGKIKKLPCSKCGSKVDVQAHHEDYDKPFDIVWFCRDCHSEFHYAKLRRIRLIKKLVELNRREKGGMV